MPEDSILNQPNSIFGLIFFVVQLILCKLKASLEQISKSRHSKSCYILVLFRENELAFQAKLFLSVLANCGSVYLAYILYFVLHDFCVVCVTTYVVNLFLLVVNNKHYNCFKKSKAVNLKKKSS